MSEKKVGKRLLTWVLVLVMTLSLLPLNVLADEGDKIYTDKTTALTDTNVEAKKSATENPDGTITITLSVTGTTDTHEQENKLPADVVLVVDTSGSMAFCTEETHKHTPSCYTKCSNPEHYYTDFIGWNHHYSSGTSCDWVKTGFGNGFYGYRTCGKTETTHQHYTHYDGTGCGTDSGTDRMSLAKSAAKRFINGLLTDGSQINVGLADFSGYNHVSIGLTDVSGKDNLIAGVDSLTSAHSDGTNYGSGLQAANKILESGKNDQKFVVFISDGAPNSDYGPADYTGVGTAASMTGVTIMTVGIGESEASYLQAISSSDKNGSPLYYQSAMTETALNAVLNTLKDTIISTIYAGTNARMTDTINTDAFEFVNADSSLSYDNNGSLTWDIKNISKDTQSVSFTIKPKEGNTTTGLFYTNTDVSLDFHSSVLDEDVSSQRALSVSLPLVFIA